MGQGKWGRCSADFPSCAAAEMKALLALAVLFSWGMPAAHGSLWELQSMITQATGRSAVQYYAFYGCHCGLGGRGQPRDATDGCCQQHDTCYASLLQHGCNAKRQRYRYRWHGGSPVCAKGSWCALLSCECDRSLALCLRQHLGTYSAAFRFYPRLACQR